MLLNLGAFSGIYLYREHVDFRKSIDGLLAIVSEQMAGEVKGTNLFIFVSRRRDKMKVLYFDRTGFALWYKRLESQKFQLPKKISDPIISMQSRELEWLLEGFDVWQMRPHEALRFEKVF
jgi:transposase